MRPKIHLSIRDVIANAWRGISAQATRSMLAGLGIAVGVAALVALTGVSESNRLAFLKELDAMGANLLTVQGTYAPSGEFVPLPPSAAQAIIRQEHVAAVGALEVVPEGLKVYRNDFTPVGETNGISVRSATPTLADVLDFQLESGRWFNQLTRALPLVVLGSEAANRLGITHPGDLVYISGDWYQTLGILTPVSLAPDLDSGIFLGDQWVRSHYPASPLAQSPKVGETELIYVQTTPGASGKLQPLLTSVVSPGSGLVQVSRPSTLDEARGRADDSLSTLGLTLGGVAMVVGGVGIANTMVVTVMQRRGEIGLRRALGARPGQTMLQFTVESTILSLLGGLFGSCLGLAGALVVAALLGQPPAIPWFYAGVGLGVCALIGTIAGLQPARSAARVPPNEALRTA